MTSFTESIVEEASLAWLAALGWEGKHGPEILAGEPGAERGETLGLTDDEVAFYDALETNDSAVKVLGDD
ncbi:MAG: hypothetical protein DCC71_25430, partial [Proteobacteria bacterium]